MFSSLGLFQSLSCPDHPTCKRIQCVFSHKLDLPPAPLLEIPLESVASTSWATPATHSLVPTKRAASSPSAVPAVSASAIPEPPSKLQRVGSSQRPQAIPSASYTNTGVPTLKVNAARSPIAIPVRQTMLKTLYDHFTVLYDSLLTSNPALPSEHALKQEEEICLKSTKFTYRNAIIQCAAALKRRPLPTSISHPSVGTEGELEARAEAKKAIQSLSLEREHLEPLVLSMEDLEKWGYFLAIPEGVGGDQPSLEGKVAKCERCGQPFQVKRLEEADECIYHWGKLFSTKIAGQKARSYTCCSRPTDSEGCTHGPHVFYENKAEDLHSRYPFSFLSPSNGSSTALDAVAMDCEMVYTTGGMRVARVSVVNGAGEEVFDELVRMDDNVHVIDYITRFSGITQEQHSKAVLPLQSIRKSLDSLINQDTILIGHALDNDLKTLRIIHHKCVDTAILFPHRAGPPYRRSLRDLVRENLGRLIQTGDASVGHSSAEDAIATLDLVRWYILDKRKLEQKPTIQT